MEFTAVVAEVRDVGRDTVAIELETPEGFDAAPGQFVKLAATLDGEEYARFYTLSSPTVGGTFEVTVGIDPAEAGPFSRHLADLAPGDELDVSGPFGRNYYEGEARAVVLAGGPGVGPAVGIAERAVRDGNEAVVVYRYHGDGPAHEARLTALREAGADVVLLDPNEAIEGAVADAVTGAADEQVFVYGFADFVAAATDALDAAGVDPADAKSENFG